jgi:hypothetical protein
MYATWGIALIEKAMGPLNTKKGRGRHSLQRHIGVVGVDVLHGLLRPLPSLLNLTSAIGQNGD